MHISLKFRSFRAVAPARRPWRALAVVVATGTFAAGAVVTQAMVRGDYAGVVRKGNGGASAPIDVQGTLANLQARKIHTYQYLIYTNSARNSEVDLNSLGGFLTEAAKKKINVHVTLTPPSETSLTDPRTGKITCRAEKLLPYWGSYDQWFAHLGTLASSHKNLTAVAMDDYGRNDGLGTIGKSDCSSFNPKKLDPAKGQYSPGAITRWQKIMQEKSKRKIPVLPVLYTNDFYDGSYESIKKETNGVIWAFSKNDKPNSALTAEYQKIHKKYPGLYIMVMLYSPQVEHQGHVIKLEDYKSQVAQVNKLASDARSKIKGLINYSPRYTSDLPY